ncbi:phosphatase PAP2 family protein [Emcibacter sp.]|uniref:phosphatase PAP2 family protein n=1 Tax=Emcibacter sp. TaxID=1979954 RepID=UPI003A90944D
MNSLVLKLARAKSNSFNQETVRGVVQTYMPFILIFLLYVLTANLLTAFYDMAGYVSYRIYKAPYYLVFLAILLVKAVSHFAANRGDALSEEAYQELYDDWLKPSSMVKILIPFVLVTVLMSIFSSLKTILPQVNPFYLDQTFYKLDQILHFGYNPWEITHALFGSVTATTLIDFCYRMWFLALLVNTVWMIINYKLGKLHHQYLVAYGLCWVLLGSFLAIALSSAGPCFYGSVVDGPDVYAPLMERLREISATIGNTPQSYGLTALNYQAVLWYYYTDDYLGIGSGITAMPSMHVSFAMLLYLSGRTFGKLFGYIFLAYLVIIQIGSVHLGWHYALDGYVSMIGTWMIWRFSGWLVDRYSVARAAEAA